MSGFGMIVPLIPVYGKQLGATTTHIGVLMAGFFAGRLVSQVPAGIISDRLGRRPVLIGSLVGYILTCIGYASVASPVLLIAFRLLQGLSAGFFSVAARALMSDMGGPRLRGTAQSIYSSSVNLGFVLGPVVGSLLAVNFGMSAPFWTSAFLSFAALIALCSISLQTKRRVKVKSDRSPWRGIAISIGDSRVSLLALINLLYMAGLSVIMTLFPVAGEAEIAGGLAFVGTAFTISGISGLIFGPFAGRLSDRMGRAPFMFIGAVLAAAEGAALFLTRGPVVICFGFFLGGVGAAAFVNSLHAALGDITKKRQRGTVTGIIGLTGEVGGIAGSLIAPFVWAQTDLSIPFGLQLVFTVLAFAPIIWLWRLKTLKPVRRSIVRESLIPG
jgi:MFS family permease